MIADIITRLQGSGAFVSVGGAEDLSALEEGTAARHSEAFVVPGEDLGEPSRYVTGAWDQHVNVTFLVAVAIRRAGDAKGAERALSIDGFRDAIEAQLGGWVWTPGALPCALVTARAGSGGKGLVWYVQTWSTTRDISRR